MSKKDEIVFAENMAPYTDPGAAGQTRLEAPRELSSVDEVAAGTPPTGTHGGTNQGDGERYASLAAEQEDRAALELGARHTGTNKRDEKYAGSK